MLCNGLAVVLALYCCLSCLFRLVVREGGLPYIMRCIVLSLSFWYALQWVDETIHGFLDRMVALRVIIAIHTGVMGCC